MPLSGFADYITPADKFFVRTHVYVPKVNLNDWRLKIDGVVDKPVTLTMEDIRRMPAVEMVAVVECAGNGRSFFDPPVPGLQWSVGAVGNARWRGVRLADVLKRAGVRESAVEVLFDGADEPLGTMQDFRRSITIKKALDPNTLLAYEMNGQPISLKHGFPMRVCAAGWASDSWVKWLTSITVLDKPWDGFWMKNAYRWPGHGVPPGTSLTPEQMVPVASLKVKSIITSGLPGTRQVDSGLPKDIRGVAWAGDAGPVVAVEVSSDNGQSWEPAQLFKDQETQFGWRQWVFPIDAKQLKSSDVIVRARDAAGNTQPLEQEWNPSGYLWNVAQRASLRPQEQPAVLENACLECHGTDVIRQQRLTRAQWDREITKMSNWGAQVKAEDRETLLNYLATQFRVK